MAHVRIAALAVALLSVELSAQPAAQGHLTIQVTDTTGAVIQGARIEIDQSLPMPGPVLTTDGKGRAVLDLPVGVHTLSIAVPNFKQWTRHIDLQSGISQLVNAKLEIAVVGDPVIVEFSDPDLPLSTLNQFFFRSSPCSIFPRS